jgi:hypothetical protein
MDFSKYGNKMDYPVQPKMPFLKHEYRRIVEKVEEYTKELKQYHKDMIPYNEQLKKYREHDGELIQQFKQDLFKNCNVKDEAKGEKVYSKAWEDGHSDGFESVANYFERYLDFARELGAEV